MSSNKELQQRREQAMARGMPSQLAVYVDRAANAGQPVSLLIRLRTTVRSQSAPTASIPRYSDETLAPRSTGSTGGGTTRGTTSGNTGTGGGRAG